MKLYIDGKPKGKKTKNGDKFYEEFQSKFWEKPGRYYLTSRLILLHQLRIFRKMGLI
jgi:hypothetical protein